MAQSGLLVDDLAARHVGPDVIGTLVETDCGGDSYVPPGNSEAKVKGTSWESKTIDKLLYRLTGLLVLQNLYSMAVSENYGLKAQIMKLEKMCYQLKEQIERCARASTVSFGDSEKDKISGTTGVEEGEYRGDDHVGISLLSPLFNTMQRRVTNVEKTVSETEGTTAKGLVMQNRDLKLAYQHQESVIKTLQEELEVYHQLKLPTQQTGSAISRRDEALVDELLRYHELLLIERTLVKELGLKLEERTTETTLLRERLNFEHYGRKQTLNDVSNLLNGLVLCCLQIPCTAKDLELKAELTEVQKKCENLAADFRNELVAASQLISDDLTKNSFLCDPTEEQVYSQEMLVEMSVPELHSKIIELQEQLQYLRHLAKTKVIEQMKKYKQASMKVKDLEEKMCKLNSDKLLLEEQLRQEISETQTKLLELQQSLGQRSSYAAKAAQSVRSLVDLLEEQKAELKLQCQQLREEVALAKRRLKDSIEQNSSLEKKLIQVQNDAKVSRAKMQDALDALRSEVSQLQEEKRTLEEKHKVLEELLKRDQMARRLAEEKIQRLEFQISECELKKKQYRADNENLKAKIGELQLQVQKLCHPGELQQSGPRQTSELIKSAGRSVRYVPGDIPRPELVSSKISNHLQAFGDRSEEVNYQPSGSTGNSSSGPDIRIQTKLPPTTGASHFYRCSELNESDGAASLQPSQKESGQEQPQTLRDSLSMLDTSVSQTMSREQRRSDIYCRNPISASHARPASSNIMKCFRCGTRFPSTSMDDYEKHIRKCYSSDIQ